MRKPSGVGPRCGQDVEVGAGPRELVSLTYPSRIHLPDGSSNTH